MPVHPGRHRPSPSPATIHPPALLSLATGVDEAFEGLSADDPAHVLRVVWRRSSPEPELSVLPLEIGAHPAAVMAGFTAPPEWCAVGVLTAGRAHEVGTAEGGRWLQHDPHAVRLTMLQARSGSAVTFVTPVGSPHAKALALHEPPIGLLADACRRVLGLATEPPEVGPATWLVARWLDRLLAAAMDQPGVPRDWAEAAALHPLAAAGATPSPEELAITTAGIEASVGWERLRTLAAHSCMTEPVLPPEVAEWMDAGSFARHLLADELPAQLVMAELDALVAASVLAAVRQAIPASCLDPSA